MQIFWKTTIGTEFKYSRRAGINVLNIRENVLGLGIVKSISGKIVNTEKSSRLPLYHKMMYPIPTFLIRTNMSEGIIGEI